MIRRNNSRAARLPILFAFALCAALASPLFAAASPWPTGMPRIAMDTSRIAGDGVYGSAVAAAKRAYPDWTGVEHVVIASGEAGALTDAAAASSLCWVYDAPLLLTAGTSLPAVTRDALAAIVSENPSVTVHVVGSSVAIPAARLAQITSAAGTATVEQPWKTASTYSLAASIAGRVRDVAASNGSVVPSAALIVDGSRASHVWDVVSAASVSRASGVPVLYVGATSVPPSTASALAAAGHPVTIVVGGTSAVSSALYTKVGAGERWSGSSRSLTAVSVARHAAARGWSTLAHVAVACTALNALIGGSLSGAAGGVLLFTDTARLSRASWTYLSAYSSSLSTAYAVGPASSISAEQLAELGGGPSMPWFASGAPGKYVGESARIVGYVGGNATTLQLYVGGEKVRAISVKPWSRFNFSAVAMPKGSAKVTAVSGNPDGMSAKATRTVHRLKYPFATCIVIDKSQFKLYWIKHNTLVRTFPVAIGRSGMETPPATWKILVKYHTNPGGVYGPRKMRLFRRRGNSWVFTRYGIHGTNQPWVIGTKASHGCIRMYNRDVLKLFPLVKLGTMVVTRR